MIQIRQAINMVKGTVTVGRPKSRDSYRDVPVPTNLRWCAMRLRDTDRKFIWEVGKADSPCNPSYFRTQFKHAIGLVDGVRVLTPHSCRHTYVSQLQGLGVDIETIKSIVGHAEVDMTTHYLHVQAPIREDAAKRFTALIDRPPICFESASALPGRHFGGWKGLRPIGRFLGCRRLCACRR